MLNALHIENIAVIEKADIEFNQGFNVLTGETGAGKSIIIDSINAILGERTSHDLVRIGSEGALVSALFTNVNEFVKTRLEEMGYLVDNEILITKKISQDGKSSIRINGAPATTAIVKGISQSLINIHGQHDSQSLLSKEKHIVYLDSYVNDYAVLKQYKQAYSEYKTILKKLDDLQKLSVDDMRRHDQLKYEIEEIEEAELEVGEIDKLKKHRDFIKNSENIAKNLSVLKEIISGTDDIAGLLTGIDSAVDVSSDLSKYISDFTDIQSKLTELRYDLEDIGQTASEKLSKIDYDPYLLEQIERRLDYLYKLSMKYGKTEEEMLSYYQSSMAEFAGIESREADIETAKAELNTALKTLTDIAKQLSEIRRVSAESLSTQICSQLAFLDMPKVKFKVQMVDSDFTSNGKDDVEFLISANAGEPPKPLTKIASGGELSRIMLAIKSILTDNDEVSALIFDEIDTGISGSAAQKVGVKLKQISKQKQVICVTHLAQIAALADTHYKIEKHSDDDSTYTQVIPLDKEGRINEVARIMSAGVVTDTSRKFAEELMNNEPFGGKKNVSV